MTIRPALIALPLLLAACADSATEPEAIVADAELTNGGTVCPQDHWVDLDAYVDDGVPAPGDDFLARNAERDGVVTTASGLQYKVVQAGLEDGVAPEPGSYVRAKYHGILTDGTVFDSAYNDDRVFETATNRVIPGWIEALESMKPCEARILYIPSELAYGKFGAGNVIGPDADLIFYMQMLGALQ